MNKKKQNKKEEWEWFDDCAICQATKNGKTNNAEDLMKAFKETEKHGAIVGGDFFNKNTPQMAMRTASKNDLYYDAMDALNAGDFKIAIQFLKEAQNLDQDYAQTYIGFANVYGVLGEKTEAKNNIKVAFEKTIKKFKKWPKEMPWFDLDNRAYLRAIQYRADIYLDDDEKEKAIELYKLLLKLNPNDNQGARYILAGLYAGIGGDEIDKMFEEGNKKQNWDKLEKLVNVQNKKYSFWKRPKNLA